MKIRVGKISFTFLFLVSGLTQVRQTLTFKRIGYIFFLMILLGVAKEPMAATIEWGPNGFDLQDDQLGNDPNNPIDAINTCTATTVFAQFLDLDGIGSQVPNPAIPGTNFPFPDFRNTPAPGGRVNMQMDANATNQSTQLILDFGNQPASNLSFSVFDVDFSNAPNGWTDIVRISAVDGVSPVPVAIACTDADGTCSFTVTGNNTGVATATGDANNPGDPAFLLPNGMAQVSILAPVTRVTIEYIAGGTILESQFIAISSLNIDCQADLVITKNDDIDPIIAGNLLTYTMVVNNNGPDIAENVVVTDNLQPGLTSPSTTGCFNDPTGIPNCNLGTIAINGSTSYTVTAVVDASNPAGTITNIVSVTSSTVDPVPGNNTDTENTTIASQTPRIGIAKNLLSVVPSGNGVFTVTIRLTLENFGNILLNNLELFDDIETQFAGLNPGGFIATSNGALATNPNWDGTASSNILQAAQSLAVGGTDAVDISFQVTSLATTASVANIAIANGTPPGGTPVTDTSTDGLNPDPNGDRNPDELVPTLVTFNNPLLGIAKDLLSVTANGNDAFIVTIRLTLENFGNVILNSLEIFDDIITQFAGLNPTSFIAISNGALTTNPNWNGTATSNILQDSQSLAVGGTDSVNISFQITPVAAITSVANIAIANGTPPVGPPVTDTSTDGLNPDPNGDRIPDEQVPTPVIFSNPLLGVAKDLLSVTANGSGAFIVTIRLTLENFGNVILNNIELFDDIITQFAGLNPTSFIAISNGALTTNPNWNGTATSNILQGSQNLAAGGNDSVNISFQVTPGATTSRVENLVTARGTPPSGLPVTDISTDGLDPDPNNNRIPDEQLPTPIIVPPDPTENPVIGMAKSVNSLVDNGNGTFNVQFTLTLENLGDVPLNNLVVVDDIVGQFTGLNPINFTAVDGSLLANSSWDGLATTNILQTGQSLAVGESRNVFIGFQVTPTAAVTVNNLAFTTGDSPTGTPVTDTSTNGLDPDPDGDRNPNENVPTPVLFNTPAIPTLNIWALGSLFVLLSLLGGRITRRRIIITR